MAAAPPRDSPGRAAPPGREGTRPPAHAGLGGEGAGAGQRRTKAAGATSGSRPPSPSLPPRVLRGLARGRRRPPEGREGSPLARTRAPRLRRPRWRCRAEPGAGRRGPAARPPARPHPLPGRLAGWLRARRTWRRRRWGGTLYLSTGPTASARTGESSSSSKGAPAGGGAGGGGAGAEGGPAPRPAARSH